MAEEVETDEAKKKVGNESEALTFNQEIVELLQLLNYEDKFCDKELQPISSMCLAKFSSTSSRFSSELWHLAEFPV